MSTRQSAFNPETGDWELAWPERITQHDLVYLSPPGDPMQGIPLGNGDVGALLWCESSRIIIALNKCDLWDDAQFGRFHNWAPNEEDKSTALRHAGRLIIDFGVPLLDPFYLKDFEARLDLASAQARIYASTPFGELHLTAYVSAAERVLVVNCESDISEKVSQEVILERWGSRSFMHWYSLVRRDPAIGLVGTEVTAGEEEIILTHELTSGEFAVGCKLFPKKGLKLSSKRLHSRSAKYEIESDSSRKEWSLFLAVTSPLKKGTAPKVVREIVATVTRKGEEKLLVEHLDFWKKFWSRSYINISNDYLENLWCLTMYYAGSSQRGASPATFVNGLWGWNRDVHPWSFYFHWNQRMIYWPLLAAGHPELMMPYLNYRFDSLPHAIEDARDWFGAEGAFISDVAERRGYNDENARHNHTPVAEIAVEFWRYYQFTGNKVFLREKALPFMTKAAEFFESLLEKRTDGLYHAKSGTICEGGVLVEDAVTELSMARSLFEAVLKAAREAGTDLGDKEGRWREIADNLVPLLMVTAPEEVISERNGRLILETGPFRGTEVPSRKLIAAGRKIEDRAVLASRVYSAEPPCPRDWSKLVPLVQFPLKPSLPYPYMKYVPGIFPGAYPYAVFPAEIIGLKNADLELFKALVSTVKAYSPELMGIEYNSIVLARLGLADEAMALLEDRPDIWQIYCNGFARANWEDVSKSESLWFFGTNMVRDADVDRLGDPANPGNTGKIFPVAAWPFRHMEMETMSVLAGTINEMLMQSYDGIIRIAPAFKWDAEFSLHAVSGFVVSSEIKNGSAQWVAIKSLLGNHCKIENPWGAEQVYICESDSIIKPDGSEIISFDTVAGNMYILSTDKDIKKTWEVRRRMFKKNVAPKMSKKGMASLGLPRMF